MKLNRTAVMVVLMALLMATAAQGASARFTGIVTSVANTTEPFQVGDTFSATVFFNPRTHAITRTNLHIGVSYFSYPEDSTSFIYQNSLNNYCFISYQVYQSRPTAHLNVQLFVGQSCINEWIFFLNGQTIGQLTEIPTIYP